MRATLKRVVLLGVAIVVVIGTSGCDLFGGGDDDSSSSYQSRPLFNSSTSTSVSSDRTSSVNASAELRPPTYAQRYDSSAEGNASTLDAN